MKIHFEHMKFSFALMNFNFALTKFNFTIVNQFCTDGILSVYKKKKKKMSMTISIDHVINILYDVLHRLKIC